MITFWILFFIYCICFPLIYFLLEWLKWKKEQLLLPLKIYNAIRGVWTDDQLLFDSLEKVHKPLEAQLIYSKLYGRHLTEDLQNELNTESFKKSIDTLHKKKESWLTTLA